MRAYLLGYNHGTNDGYHSTLIEQGRCEKSYDESLDVEYVTMDEVLEIIDKAAADYEAMPTEIDVGREKAVISFEKKDGMLAMASMIRVLVLGLRGEE